MGSSLHRAISWNIGRQVITVLLGVAANAVLARSLGPGGLGTYQSMILVSLTAAAFGSLGIESGGIYNLSRGEVDSYSARSTMLIIGLSSGLILACILALLIHINPHWVVLPLENALILPALFAIPLQLVGSLGAAYWLGRREFGRYSLCIAGPQAIFLLVLGMLFACEMMSPSVAGWAFVASLVVSAFLPLALNVEKGVGSRNCDSSFAKSSFAYGWKAYLADMITFLHYRADMYIVGYYSGPAALGIYTIAVMVVERIWFASQAASTALFPTVSAMKLNDAGLAEVTPKVLRGVLVVGGLMGFGVLLISDPLIRGIFGEQYADSVLPLRILLPGVIVWGGARVLCADIAGRGLPEVNLRIAAVSAVINIALNLIAVPRFGVIGAAVASSISYSVLGVMALYRYLKISGLTAGVVLGGQAFPAISTNE